MRAFKKKCIGNSFKLQINIKYIVGKKFLPRQKVLTISLFVID